MRYATNFLTGLLIGGLVGASVALLLAPRSGENLRLQIRSEVDRIQAGVKQAAQDRRAEMEKQLAALRAPRRVT